MTTPDPTPDARALALLLRLAAAQERGETCAWALYQQIALDYGVDRARADAAPCGWGFSMTPTEYDLTSPEGR